MSTAMERDRTLVNLYRQLVTAMNVVGVTSATGILGHLLEIRRQGVPMLAAMDAGLTAWFWPIELWAASVWASRWLLRSGRLNLATFTALLPLLSLLGIKILEGL